LPKEHDLYAVYQNRVIYKQYLPHIGYENLLGFMPDGMVLTLPEGAKNIRLIPR
jgi:hypothetical protein